MTSLHYKQKLLYELEAQPPYPFWGVCTHGGSQTAHKEKLGLLLEQPVEQRCGWTFRDLDSLRIHCTRGQALCEKMLLYSFSTSRMRSHRFFCMSVSSLKMWFLGGGRGWLHHQQSSLSCLCGHVSLFFHYLPCMNNHFIDTLSQAAMISSNITWNGVCLVVFCKLSC